MSEYMNQDKAEQLCGFLLGFEQNPNMISADEWPDWRERFMQAAAIIEAPNVRTRTLQIISELDKRFPPSSER